MKWRILFIGLMTLGLVSCSSDDGDSGSDSVEGTWDLVSLQLDGTTEEEEAAELLFNQLAAQGCYLITLIFSDGGQAILETSINYLDPTNLLLGGLTLDCPTQSDTESASYVYENNQLTITDSDGMSTTLDAVLSGDRLTLDLEGSEFDDFGSSGSMVFERR